MALKLTSKERLLAAIRWEKIDQIPVFAGESPCVPRLDGKDYKKVGDALGEAALASWSRIDSDIIAVRPGNAIIVDAFGARLKWPEVGDPMFDTPLVTNHAEADRLVVPDPYKDKYVLATLRALKIIKKKVGERVLIGTTLRGIFNITALLFGTEALMKFLVKDIKLVHKVLRKVSKAQINYGLALLDGGADILFSPDATSSPYCISRPIFEEVVLPYVTQQVDAFHKVGGLHSINTYGYGHIDLIGRTGSDIISFNEADMAVTQQVFVNRNAVSGPIDTAGVLFTSSQEELEQKVKDIVTRLPFKTGAILSVGGSGKDKHDKLKQLIRLARKYGDYR